MADGWLRQLRGNASVGVASAGIVGGTAVKEGAISVMKDAGIDISTFTSDAMADFNPEDFDVVISCCGCGGKLDGDKEVWKKRPVFQDWNLDDPPAIDPGDLSAYRRVRDESKAKVLELLDMLSKPYGPQYRKNVMFLIDCLVFLIYFEACCVCWFQFFSQHHHVAVFLNSCSCIWHSKSSSLRS
jgi:arsenate reductase